MGQGWKQGVSKEAVAVSQVRGDDGLDVHECDERSLDCGIAVDWM